MKKEQVIITLMAAFIAGYIWGRQAIKSSPAGSGLAAATAPESAAATPAEPAAVAAAPAPPAPAPVQAAAPGAAPSAPSAPSAAPAAAPAAPADPNQIWRVTLDPADGRKGPDTAPVKVVVFGAFGNQETVDFAPALGDVVKTYGDKVQIRFKHKVIPAPHPDAQMAAEASLACQAQGKFWPFFQAAIKTTAISRSAVDEAAKAAGCDVGRLKADLDSGKWRGQALKDSLLANEVAAHSYPNIMVNGIRLRPPKNWESLKPLIDEQLKKAEDAIKGGTSAAKFYDDTIKGGKFFEQTAGPAVRIATDGSPVLGSTSAKIQVQVFEDFQCPFCSKIAPSIKEFQKRFPNDVSIVYKHMPLTDIHDHAQQAAEASMAAAAQGKFWEYHDVLFANQSALDSSNLEQYAQQAGLDVAKFKADLAKGVGRDLISRDANEGRQVGVSGTPSVFINGLKYQGPKGYPPEGLEAVARAYMGLK